MTTGQGESLDTIVRRLEQDGYDATQLRSLQIEFDVLERPAGLITRLTVKAKASAGVHWSAFVGELRESKEAMGLGLRRMVGGQLSPEERDKVRAQMVDLVKVFPAGLIAAANSAFPVPGTGMFTPWILNRLGLMPSRWREAHLLDQLRKQSQLLSVAGYQTAASALDRLRDEVERDADERDAVGAGARLLTHWDANDNGRWDDDERTAYQAELDRVRAVASRSAARKRWYIEDEGEVFGALRLSELLADAELAEHLASETLLVCYDGKSGWVALPHLLGSTPVLD
ncbi:MAG: hypothetical protein JKY37_18255 [Nannocystaceae bacterium]|nr:hypothetical protein [Nannocystaceae bacterium]